MKPFRHCYSNQRLVSLSTMTSQAQGMFWHRHWTVGSREMTICCILHELFVKQINQAFAKEIYPLAQILHSHPFLLCCCGRGTSLNGFKITLLREKLSFFVWRFSPNVCNAKDYHIRNVNHRILSYQVPTLLRTLSNDARMQRIAMIIVECNSFWPFPIQQVWKSPKNVISNLILNK